MPRRLFCRPGHTVNDAEFLHSTAMVILVEFERYHLRLVVENEKALSGHVRLWGFQSFDSVCAHAVEWNGTNDEARGFDLDEKGDQWVGELRVDSRAAVCVSTQGIDPAGIAIAPVKNPYHNIQLQTQTTESKRILESSTPKSFSRHFNLQNPEAAIPATLIRRIILILGP